METMNLQVICFYSKAAAEKKAAEEKVSIM
jgi:hypothetical protein